MRRTCLKGARCPVARSLDEIGDWWSLLIIRDAFRGMHRFSEFQKSLGLARNILTVRLRSLVEHGILTQRPASDGSAYKEYALTQKGRDLFPVIVALRQWGDEHLFPEEERYSELVDRKDGKAVLKLEVRAADGRVLAPRDTEVKRFG